ncbi:MAG: hypothetical protein IKE29_02310 [Paenibacillus sp.]|uniref:hypothetical protein n=1 Tax=Paenibacillus sp. TaxID=58172 RepID=UPI0025FA0B56|nr:hypothetical protein [Paenibacillus sp.]MBR2563435.1 hypothetical protein [Paenibacillus sp.]
MYIFKIHGKEYKVRFTYRMICEGDLLDKVSAVGDFSELDAKGVISKLAITTAELLLAGLQKYHSDEFGYEDEKDRKALIDEVLDMFDDYEDESTEENPQSAFTLFRDLQGELERNGFLSAMMTAATEAEEVKTTADQTKAEMENTPARVVAMTPIESES